MEPTDSYIRVTRRDGIARIEFFHPQSNSMPAALLAQLAEALRQEGTHADSRVIVLQSAGDRAFCAGASFDELSSIRTEEQGRTFFNGFAQVINACRTNPKIIIGRVQGKAVGGGVGLAAATDYCFASGNASVKLSELAVGIGPFVVGPAVERKIGLAAFSQLTLDATVFYPALWAHNRGLFADVFETTAMLDVAVDAFATQLAASNPEALRELKAVFWQGTDHWETLLSERAAISGRLVLSDFTQKAIAAFKNKAK